MILVDPRMGKFTKDEAMRKTFLRHLNMHLWKWHRLEFGDVAWLGNGPQGKVWVGMELKRFNDLLSSITSGRLGGRQLIGMSRIYQYSYLVIQADHFFRKNKESGVIEERVGRGWRPVTLGTFFMWRSLIKYLTSVQIQGNVKLWFARNSEEVADIIDAVYSWFQAKWEDHSTFHVMDLGGVPSPDFASLLPPTYTQQMASRLPGIGWDKSKKVEEHFGCMLEMAGASEEEWMKIKGIGRKIAEQSRGILRGIS